MNFITKAPEAEKIKIN